MGISLSTKILFFKDEEESDFDDDEEDSDLSKQDEEKLDSENGNEAAENIEEFIEEPPTINDDGEKPELDREDILEKENVAETIETVEETEDSNKNDEPEASVTHQDEIPSVEEVTEEQSNVKSNQPETEQNEQQESQGQEPEHPDIATIKVDPPHDEKTCEESLEESDSKLNNVSESNSETSVTTINEPETLSKADQKLNDNSEEQRPLDEASESDIDNKKSPERKLKEEDPLQTIDSDTEVTKEVTPPRSPKVRNLIKNNNQAFLHLIKPKTKSFRNFSLKLMKATLRSQLLQSPKLFLTATKRCRNVDQIAKLAPRAVTVLTLYPQDNFLNK